MLSIERVRELLAAGPPACLHDEEHRHELERHVDGSGTQRTRCAGCGALLYSKALAPTGSWRIGVCHDDVYELLYSHEGRRKLLRVLLTEHLHWSLPKPWEAQERHERSAPRPSPCSPPHPASAQCTETGEGCQHK